MHGECKTPGGKLAVVDLELMDGLIRDVRLSGDFFVHPEANARAIVAGIQEGLEKAPAGMAASALAARIRAAMPVDADLLGTSPEAVAIALRRALGMEEEEAVPMERIGSFEADKLRNILEPWKGVPWRLLPEVARSPALNVALDEVLLDACAACTRPPTLRFWRWTHPAVIIGRSQSVSNEVDVEETKRRAMRIVRRLTGGGAMFLEPSGAITYSLYLPETLLAGLTIRQSYEVCESWLVAGLRSLGVDAHHVPINDIACSDGKIGGAAQCRRKGWVLHHTTLAYEMDPAEMMQVLRISREKLSDKKGVTSASKRVSPIRKQTGRERGEIVQALFDQFQAGFGGTVDEVSESELQAAEKLVESKYSTDAWTYEIA